VERYQRTVYNIAFRMVRSREAALDLAQEAFLEAYAHLADFDPARPFAPWLYRIVHNRSLNHMKRAGHRAAPRLAGDEVLERSEAPTSPDQDGARLDRRRLTARLHAEVAELPTNLQGAFVLRYLEDRSVADVAAILSIPVNTVKTHLFRARERLRERLRWWFDD